MRLGVVDTATGKRLKWIPLPPQRHEKDETGARAREEEPGRRWTEPPAFVKRRALQNDAACP